MKSGSADSSSALSGRRAVYPRRSAAQRAGSSSFDAVNAAAETATATSKHVRRDARVLPVDERGELAVVGAEDVVEEAVAVNEAGGQPGAAEELAEAGEARACA